MTIGIYDNYDPVEGINPDFKSLINCRAKVCEEFNIDVKEFELSMGMSADFEHAVSFLNAYVAQGLKWPVIASVTTFVNDLTEKNIH